MTRLRKQKTSLASLLALFVIAAAGGATAKPLGASWQFNPVLPQTLGLTFPLPTSVPVGTSIRIGGSSSMETINQVLKQRFEQQFVGTEVKLNTQGTGPAIKDLLDGNADLAAIGRSLTEQEKAQGLVSVPVSRHKIAIIVGSENPFKDDLTFEQFAKIFHGEIKDWAQLGGEPGPIRFIDRPDNSDTRQAFRNYPVFKKAPFTTGKTAKQVAQDSTSQVVQALRTDGLGYAIADQLQGRGDVRVLTMHNTLPSNPKYPFSQPLVYVYKGPQPNPAAQSFLGFATAPTSRKTIETARKEASSASLTTTETTPPRPKATVPSPLVSPLVTAAPPKVSPAPAATVANQFPWWWLLGVPLLGGLLWWLLQNREAQFEPEEMMPLPTAVPAPSVDAIAPDRGTVAPEPPMPVDAGKIGGAPLAGRVNEFSTARDTSKQETLQADSTVLATGLGAAGLGNTAMSAFAGEGGHEIEHDRTPDNEPASHSQIFLVPRSDHNAYIHWDVTQADKDALKHQGGQQLVLRVYEVADTTSATAYNVQQFLCHEWDRDQHVPIPVSNLDYVAELGYTTLDGRFLKLARSPQTRVSGS